MDAVNIIAVFFHVSINWLYGIEEPDTTESEFRKACQWLEEAEISIDAPDQDDGLQQYYLPFENDGILEISCKMDKTDIIHLANECVNDANKTRDDIAIKYIKRALKSQNNQHHDNIIYLTGQPGDVFSPDPSSAEGVIIMSPYEEMQIILTIALLVVAILNLKNKK